jgi:hypothetical protein
MAGKAWLLSLHFENLVMSLNANGNANGSVNGNVIAKKRIFTRNNL